MTLDEIRDVVQEMFDLEDAVVDRIEFTYKTKIGSKGAASHGLSGYFDSGSLPLGTPYRKVISCYE